MKVVTERPLDLESLPGTFAIARLDAGEPTPGWVAEGPAGFLSVTRTAEELSIVCPEGRVPERVRAERGWRMLKVRGPLPFELTGVLASIAGPLAEAGVGLVALSTFDTDYVLVRADQLAIARDALARAGHRLGDDSDRPVEEK